MAQHTKNIVIIVGVLIVVATLLLFFLPQETNAPVEVTGTEDGVEVEEAETDTTTAPESSAPAETTTATPQPQATTPTPTAPKPSAPVVPKTTYAALVSYTDTGFKPIRVTIKEGQTIRFINQSEQKMWVASAIHPVHSAYQERSPNDCLGSTFDQCRAVEKGEYWDFTFNVPGTWDFHNHMKGNETGEITVLPLE